MVADMHGDCRDAHGVYDGIVTDRNASADRSDFVVASLGGLAWHKVA